MRIVHLLLTSRFAGSERHALELAAAQAARGDDVALVLRRAATRDAADAIARRVDPRVRIEVVGDLAAAWQARRVVRRLRPDVAHAHLGGGCRALHGVHGCLRVATLHIHYKARQHGALDGLVAIAPWQLADIPAPMRANTVQIDNWTMPTPPTPGARERLRAQAGIPADAFLVGALGRVERSKGHDLLLEAFRRADAPGARLAIVGHGREWARLRRAAPAEVAMPGFAERPRDWLEAFDLFVSAAHSEPFGLVLLEAMAAGLPVVATATEGARHLAERADITLVPRADPDALAAALREAVRAGPQRLSHDLSHYRLEDKVAQLAAFYREGLRRQRG